MRKILYFIAEPTAEDIAFAKLHGMNIRNPDGYSANDYIEPCDFVYGNPPEAYLDRFQMFEVEVLEPQKPKELKTDEIKALLTEKGIAFNHSAKKTELLALLAQAEEKEDERASDSE